MPYELNDSLIKQKFPDAKDRIYNESYRGRKRQIKIYCPATDFYNTTVYLFAHTRQVIKNVQTSLIKDGETFFFVNKGSRGRYIGFTFSTRGSRFVNVWFSKGLRKIFRLG